MTAAFTPAPGILDCTKNTLNFMKVNAGMFWHFLKPYLPYLIGAQLVGIGVMLALLRGYVDIAAEFEPARPPPSLARFLREPR